VSHPIRRIIVILTNRTARYWGFRYIRCSDGATVEAQSQGGESNILMALGNSGDGWLNDYFWTQKTVPESEIFGLPCAGCHPDEIRKWVEARLPAEARIEAASPEEAKVEIGVWQEIEEEKT